MAASTAITVAPAPQVTAMGRWKDLTEDQLQILADTIARGATPNELAFFEQVCNRLQLDPFAGQICLVKRWDKGLQREVATPQVKIGGFRVIAERTGLYLGRKDILWCGPDGQWVDVWLPKNPPVAAKCSVKRKGYDEPITAVANFEFYAQMFNENGTWRLTDKWRRGGPPKLGKCAEALALRAAFPQELSGIYTDDEMRAVGNDPAHTAVVEAVTDLPRAAVEVARMPTPDELRERAEKAVKLAELEAVVVDAEQLSPKQQEQLATLFALKRTELTPRFVADALAKKQARAAEQPAAVAPDSGLEEAEARWAAEREAARVGDVDAVVARIGAIVEIPPGRLSARDAGALIPVLQKIEQAKTSRDLGKLSPAIEKLPSGARKMARTAWALRSNELDDAPEAQPQ